MTRLLCAPLLPDWFLAGLVLVALLWLLIWAMTREWRTGGGRR